MLQDFDERIRKLIGQAIPGGYKKVRISEESTLHELGLSSLAVVTLVFKFEEEFNVDVLSLQQDLDLVQLRTVKDVLALGRQLVEKAHGT